MTIVRRLSQLPNWFQLCKYKAMHSASTATWYEQLCVRRDCWTMTQQTCSDNFSVVLQLIRDTPVVDVFDHGPLQIYFAGGPLAAIKSGARNSECAGVHALTPRELIFPTLNMDEKEFKAMCLWRAAIKAPFDKPRKVRFYEWLNQPLHALFEGPTYREPVYIDLSLSDDSLLREFKDYLTKRRTHAPHPFANGAKHRINLDRLSKFAILPYLDLRIWERQTGARIPNRVMADAIFPGAEVEGEENVRKTTKRLVDQAISVPFLNELLVRANAENPEPKRS